MGITLFQRLPLPRSLRWQFRLALVALGLLIVAGSILTIYALQVSAQATEQLAEQRLIHMRDAQDLVQRALLIERGTGRMLAADSPATMRQRYGEIIQQLDALDRVAEKLSTASADVSVLSLQHSEQLFRNAAVIVAELREKQLEGGDTNSPATMLHFHENLDEAALAMSVSAQDLSEQFAHNYRAAVRQVAAISRRNERWLLALSIASLAIAWLASWHFNRHVLARLEQVSQSLRQDPSSREAQPLPVKGEDEISEMARAVGQFLEDRKRLAEAHQELEAFSYSVSHDLRAPLRAIDGFCQFLIRDYQQNLDEAGRGFLHRIHQSAQRMNELIKDILAFSRMARSEMALGTVDLGTMVREVFDEVRRPLPQRKIMLRLGELPPAKGDAAMIRQVLVNLISNAVKFTASRPEAMVEVDCIATGEMNTYRVKDNGIGFDLENAADRLFGVFQRLHGPENFEGTGIGLAIVKRIIVRHGGRVWAEAKPGEGASFYFTLPSA